MTAKVSIKIDLPRDHADYLRAIVAMGRIGETIEDVARHIVIRELDAMFRAGYHKNRMSGI